VIMNLQRGPHHQFSRITRVETPVTNLGVPPTGDKTATGNETQPEFQP
jgi:hypothetical protein